MISLGSTLIGLLVAIPAAYAMAFFPNRWTKDILLWMLSTKMMPAVGVLMPIYLLFKTANLLDTKIGLIGIMTLANLPIIVWMLYTFFKEIPGEIIEASRMDGATPLTATAHRAAATGRPRHRFDGIACHYPRLERGVLDLEPHLSKCRPAHRLHRHFFQPARPVLGKTLGRLDPCGRTHPHLWLANPAPTGPGAHLRRGQIGIQHVHA